MDYVVYGTGYGATLMLLGYAVRTWGPGWRFRDGEEAAYDRREFRSARSSWRRFTTGLGAAVATAGAVLVLLTFILMLINPGDSIGSTVALSVTGLLLVGIAVWAWMFFDRFGAWGVVALPDALSSYQPAQYDARAAQTATVAEGASADAGDEDTEEVVYDEDEFVEDEEDEVADDDSADLLARATKYELHHPEADETSGDAAEEPSGEDEEWFDAQYSKYESHHPSGGDESPDEEPEEVEEIDEYVETLTPEEVTEDIVDEADEEPVGEETGPSFESYEELVGDVDTVTDESGAGGDDAIEDDPLEVLPEAHEGDDLLFGQDPDALDEPAEGADEGAGGRDDALRRLRERQAERARQRANDDA